ncbi:MAG: D-glycero-beta-D-manno-heptose 1-phosphate adenylyltransferase [Flavobacteriales bacterium]|nr:D-glycero-beta-D-manno-heptose 1-phosphate adenylyltransferase [Flavobacteriales bacterium]
MLQNSLEKFLDSCRESGKKIVFTNGVFDILHVGHVTYLEKAAEHGDVLIVGVNDDDSVRRLNKGPERPINPEDARAKIIASLKSVDHAVIFGEDTPYELIQLIQPDVLVKGGDYDPDCTDGSDKRYMVGSDVVRAKGGTVASIPLVEGFSTTGIVSKMRAAK